jgi:hypothetical protein
MAVSDCQIGRDSTKEPTVPSRLNIDKKFQPRPVEEGDEAFRNGIFEFNITRLLSYMDAHAERFPIYLIAVADIPDYGGSRLDEEAVRAADLLRPVLFAEISPGRYNLIDGNHRVGKARLNGVPTIAARRVSCPEHVPFLTSTFAYEKYVEYWNSKLPDIRIATLHRDI